MLCCFTKRKTVQSCFTKRKQSSPVLQRGISPVLFYKQESVQSCFTKRKRPSPVLQRRNSLVLFNKEETVKFCFTMRKQSSPVLQRGDGPSRSQNVTRIFSLHDPNFNTCRRISHHHIFVKLSSNRKLTNCLATFRQSPLETSHTEYLLLIAFYVDLFSALEQTHCAHR